MEFNKQNAICNKMQHLTEIDNILKCFDSRPKYTPLGLKNLVQLENLELKKNKNRNVEFGNNLGNN